MNMFIRMPTYKDNGIELVFELNQSRQGITSPDIELWNAPAMAIGACFVANEERFPEFKQSNLYNHWVEICGDKKWAFSDVRNDFIFSDILLFVSYGIYSHIKKFLTEVHKKWRENSYDKIEFNTISFIESINKSINIYSEKDVQEYVDNYVKNYNLLTNKLLRSNIDNEEIYRDLIEELEKLNDEKHKLINQYLSKNPKDWRCFAIYITAEKKYVAFSGFSDVDDRQILDWLGERRSGFVDIAQDICNKLGVVFVKTSPKIYTYKITDDGMCSDGIEEDTSLETVINNKMPDSIKSRYSCCERKIIAYFDNRQEIMPNGSFYIKLQMCAQCVLAIQYKITGGVLIIIHDGIML